MWADNIAIHPAAFLSSHIINKYKRSSFTSSHKTFSLHIRSSSSPSSSPSSFCYTSICISSPSGLFCPEASVFPLLKSSPDCWLGRRRLNTSYSMFFIPNSSCSRWWLCFDFQSHDEPKFSCWCPKLYGPECLYVKYKNLHYTVLKKYQNLFFCPNSGFYHELKPSAVDKRRLNVFFVDKLLFF